MDICRNTYIDRGLRYSVDDDNITILKYAPCVLQFMGLTASAFNSSSIPVLFNHISEYFLKYDFLIYTVKEEYWRKQDFSEARALIENMLKKTFRNIYKKIVIPTDITQIETEDGVFNLEKGNLIYKIYLDRDYIKSLLDPDENVVEAVKKDIAKKAEDKKYRSFYSMSIYEALLNIGLVTKYPQIFYLDKNIDRSISTEDLKGNLFYIKVHEKLPLPEIIFNEVKLNSKPGEFEKDSTLAKSESWLLKQHFGKIPYISESNVIHSFCPSFDATISNAKKGIIDIERARAIAEGVLKLLNSIKEEEHLDERAKDFGAAIVSFDLRHYAEFGTSDSVYWNVIRKYAMTSNTENELDEIEELEE